MSIEIMLNVVSQLKIYDHGCISPGRKLLAASSEVLTFLGTGLYGNIEFLDKDKQVIKGHINNEDMVKKVSWIVVDEFEYPA